MKKKFFKIVPIIFIISILLIITYSFAKAMDYDWKKGTSWNDKTLSVESNYQLLSQSNGSISKIASFGPTDGKMDGSTIAGNYLLFAQYNSNNSYTTIKVVDRRNWNIVYTKKNENFGKVNNMTFNPKTNVTATDKEDKDLTSKIEITENTVNTSKAGTYKVPVWVLLNTLEDISKGSFMNDVTEVRPLHPAKA